MGMRVLATVVLMMSLLVAFIGVAGADIARPTCSSQLRADDMCYGATLPGAKAETGKKSGMCLACLMPVEGTDAAVPPRPATHAAADTAVLPDAGRSVPWRPPRA